MQESPSLCYWVYRENLLFTYPPGLRTNVRICYMRGRVKRSESVALFLQGVLTPLARLRLSELLGYPSCHST